MIGKNQKPIAVFLAAIFFISLFGLAGCSQGKLIEISTPENTLTGQITRIYVGGMVNNPGFYPLRDGDTIRNPDSGSRRHHQWR